MIHVEVDRGLRLVRVDASRPIYWPTLSEGVRWLLKGAGYALVAWLVYAYGAARQGDLSLTTIANNEWCAGIVRDHLGVTERGVGAARSANEAMVALLGAGR